MSEPSIDELLYHAKQAEQNAANIKIMSELEGEDGEYWRELFDYHSLSARALNKSLTHE